MKTLYHFLFFCLFILIFFESQAQSPSISDPNTYPKPTQSKCTYTYSGALSGFEKWEWPSNSVVEGSTQNLVVSLYFKNIKASAYKSTLKAYYHPYDSPTLTIEKEVGPFTLNFPQLTFVGGSSKNILCSNTTANTISLSPYKNIANNDIDQNTDITDEFEWTLPSGWRTSEGNTGTFVSTSSINVIPPASTSSASISVRAKANTQYSSAATLQITRNLLDFTIQGNPTVDCNATERYTVPQISGATYSWQNQSGWIGQSTTNYIDVTAQNTPDCTLSCTITLCGQSKVAQKTITAIPIHPATSIAGPSVVCSSNETFSVNNIAPMNFIRWTCSSNLIITSGDMMSPSCTVKRIGSGSGWVKVDLVPKCGGNFTYEKIIDQGISASMLGPSFIPMGSSGTWTASASGCGPFQYNWWLRHASSGPADAIIVGEGSTLTLYSSPYYDTSLSKDQSLSMQGMLQPPGYTNYYMKLQVFDAFGNTYTTPERHIIVEGDIDLMNESQGEIIDNLEGAEASSLQLNVAPNPAKDESTVEISTTEGQVMNENTEWQLEVYDEIQSLKTKMQKIRGSKQTIQTTGWKDGVYIVRVIVGNEILIKRLIVKQ